MFLLPAALLVLVLHHAHAVRIPFVVHTRVALDKRAPIPVGNTGNAQYVANITVAGNPVPVLLDTGSSDLWVYFTTPPADPSSITDTGKAVSLSYAVGRAAGTAHRAPVTLGNFTISDQAFLLVEDTSTFTGDIRSQGYQGLFGMGPNTGSVLRKNLDSKNADTMLQNVFNSANLSSNYITLLLDRQNDGIEPFKGEMSISEIVPGFENITSMPRLDVETVTRLLKSDQHWQALTDKDMGIIGPDGLPIQFDSIVPRAPDGQLVAVIDSGYTFSQVPRTIADAIYGRVQGAVYDSSNEWWLLPCGQYLNISFNFGGNNYPVHPLDVVDDNFNKIDSTGKKVCIGSFQPITSAFSLLGHYDMILGMSFLRSVYTLYNYGSWIENGTSDHPYIQISSHTDPVVARAEFVQIRLGGQDTINTDPRWALLPVNQLVHSPVSAEEKKKMYQEMVLSRWPYILLGCFVFLVLSIGFCIWKCCCKRKNGNRWSEKSALRSGLIPERFRGGKKDKKTNLGGIAEMDRETELYNHPNATAPRASADAQSRSSNQYGMAMDTRGGSASPYGSTAELVRSQSQHSLHHSPAAYQQNFPPNQQAFDQQHYDHHQQYAQQQQYEDTHQYTQQQQYDHQQQYEYHQSQNAYATQSGYPQQGYGHEDGNTNHAGYGASYAR